MAVASFHSYTESHVCQRNAGVALVLHWPETEVKLISEGTELQTPPVTNEHVSLVVKGLLSPQFSQIQITKYIVLQLLAQQSVQKKRLDEAIQENASLADHIRKLTETNDTTENELTKYHSIKSKYKEFSCKIEKDEKTISDLKAKLSEQKQSQIDQQSVLEQLQDETRQEKASLADRITALIDTKVITEKELTKCASIESEYKKLSSDMQEKENIIINLEAKLSEEKQFQLEQQSVLKKLQDEIRQEKINLANHIRKLTETKIITENELSKRVNIESEYKKMSSEMEGKEKIIIDLEAKLSEQKTSLSELKQLQDETRQEKASLAANTRKLTETKDISEKELSKRLSLESTYAKLPSEMEKKEKTISDLEAKLSEQKKSLSVLKQQLADARRKKAILPDLIRELTETTDKHEKESTKRVSIEAQYENLSSKMEETEKITNDLEDKLSEQKQSLFVLKQLLGEARQEKASLADYIRELTETKVTAGQELTKRINLESKNEKLLSEKKEKEKIIRDLEAKLLEEKQSQSEQQSVLKQLQDKTRQEKAIWLIKSEN
ncbi:myosin heavy chain, cardiac muscle isoform-like [Ptychodera flava]|uniref:myosin heavy chain, cardiac muscle isoform-like n=1 Tax=Ptychodera flava TaxID=63121 RepID=UPI00396AA68B